MNVFDLAPRTALVVDVILLAVSGVAVGYLGHRLPVRWLTEDRGPLRLRGFERAGNWYERRLAVKRWKDRLPDAGAVFAGGMAKARLPGHSRADLERFAVETRRAELVHAALVGIGPVLFVISPRALGVVMVTYTAVANVPCVVVQRYNRARIATILGT